MSLMRCTVLGAVLVACTPPVVSRAPAAPPLDVPPLKQPAAQDTSNAVRFPDGAAPPFGCFATSRRTGAVACVVGHYGATSDSGERRLTVLSSSEDATPDIPVRVHAVAGRLQLEQDSQRTLDTIMRNGDFIALGSASIVPPESPRSFGGLTVELRRLESTSYGSSGTIPSTYVDLKVIVRTELLPSISPSDSAEKTDVLFENTLSSVTCVAPSLSVRVLEANSVLIERECRLEQEAEVVVGAWLCDSARARCD
ncbi:MAG: hypothetical protein K0S65_5055 [Labilithrix sp.]|nr:hypothetical protein [Labilithrix sp.]